MRSLSVVLLCLLVSGGAHADSRLAQRSLQDQSDVPPAAASPEAPAALEVSPDRVPTATQPPPQVELFDSQSRRSRRLQVGGWVLIGLGGAATASGLLLLPFGPPEMPRDRGIVPLLSLGAAVALLGRVLLTVGEQARPPMGVVR